MRAANLINEFVRNTSATTYAQNVMLHSAVERQFEIIGEALRQLGTVAPEMAAAIPAARTIVAFRNQLAQATSRSNTTWFGPPRREMSPP